jgi:RNA polymerase primary sigma factor
MKREEEKVSVDNSQATNYHTDRSLDLYLKEISEESLITHEQEVRLAKRIHEGDPKAMEELTKANLRFVVSVAKQYVNQGLSLEDLINEGNLGLIRAAQKFDETKGYKFISYAVWWIRQAVLQALAEQSRIVRIPLNRVGILYKIGKLNDELGQVLGRNPTPREIARELNLSEEEVNDTLNISNSYISLDAPFSDEDENSLIDLLHDHNQKSPEDSLMEESLSREIEKALACLSEREAKILCLYYGINQERTHTLEEIGHQFSLTRERVRQIKEKSLEKLRELSQEEQLLLES